MALQLPYSLVDHNGIITPAITNLIKNGGAVMKISGVWMGVLAIILGILVLAWPDLIRWSIGIGLIVLGILALVRK